MIQKIHEAQQQGIYQVSAVESLCGICLANFIDAYLGGDEDGADVVARLRSSSGRTSCVLAWVKHREEAKNLDFPCLVDTDAQTSDQLQLRFRQINTA